MYELTRTIDGTPFKVTDYSLRCKLYGKGDDIWRTVRVIDNGEGKFDCILFTPYKKFDYDKDFEKLLEGAQLVDTIDENKSVTYDKHGVFKTTVRQVSTDGPKPSSQTKYWDFTTTDDGALPILSVEMDLDAGSFELYQGEMIDPLDVTETAT